MGPPTRVVEAFSHFVAQLALLGLSVHPSKCVAWSPSRREAFAVLLEDISYATDGIRVLGVSLETQEFVGGFLSSTLEEDRRGLDQIQHLGDPHVECVMLSVARLLSPSIFPSVCRYPRYVTMTCLTRLASFA